MPQRAADRIFISPLVIESRLFAIWTIESSTRFRIAEGGSSVKSVCPPVIEKNSRSCFCKLLVLSLNLFSCPPTSSEPIRRGMPGFTLTDTGMICSVPSSFDAKRARMPFLVADSVPNSHLQLMQEV